MDKSYPLALEPGIGVPALPLCGIYALVVDDDPDSATLTSFFLRDSGAMVVVAESAETALRVLAQSPLNLLISDLQMPKFDGYSLIETVRQSSIFNQIPAIALSACAMPNERARALSAGYQRHVAKPVDFDELLRTILELLGRS
jgi:CheY-like chemotaxis protein